MSHVDEGSLQAYLDGEIDGPAAAGLSDHVASCSLCAGELESLRRMGERVHAAIGLLEAPAPMLRAQAAIAAERRQARSPRRALRLGTWGLAKAAMLLLVLAGAGAAAIPDVRRAFESTLARVAELFGAASREEVVTPAPVDAVEAPAEVREVRQAFVQPVGGRVRVIIPAPTSGLVEVHVRLINSSRAEVETATSDGQVRFVSATGRVEVVGVRDGTVTVGIPRMVENASVEISSGLTVIKEGNELVLAGPAVAERGSELRFTIGS